MRGVGGYPLGTFKMVMDVLATAPDYGRSVSIDPYVNVKFDNSGGDNHTPNLKFKLEENERTSTYIPKVQFRN